MIKFSLFNKKASLTSDTVMEIIKTEEEERNKNTQSQYSNARTSAFNDPVYQSYCNLFAYASRPYNQYHSGDGLQIAFYEWSDLTKRPRTFQTTTEFLKFAEESNIMITEEAKNRINLAQYGLYGTCVKGSSKLIVQYTFCALVGAWGVESYNFNNGTVSQTRTEEIMGRDYINFYFFDCSDLSRTPRHFTSWKVWSQFMLDCNIKMSKHNEKRLKALSSKDHFGACVTGYPIVAARNSIDKLEVALKTAIDLNKIDN